MNSLRTTKRKIKPKEKSPSVESSRNWSKGDTEKYLDCIMKNGHKDLKKLQECFPAKNLESIKAFLRTAYDISVRLEKGVPHLDEWLQRCNVGMKPLWRDSIHIAQVIKYLSVDGLLENHPLPARCEGISFQEAYRLIYQALMGYPLQPVSKATADFILETFKELSLEVKKQCAPIQNVTNFLKGKSANEFIETGPTDSKYQTNETDTTIKRNFSEPRKVYKRKRAVTSLENNIPSLKIFVEAVNNDKSSNSGTINFTVTTKNSQSEKLESNIVNVSLPVSNNIIDNNEKEFLQSLSYNPFKITKKWLKEPLFINLLSNHE